MTVIAKMNVAVEPRAYGQSQLVELQCVCDNDLMVIHSPQNENQTFNQASPQGDARLNLDPEITFRQQEELYLIFQRGPEMPKFENALAVVDARCVSVTDFGGTSKRVEVASCYHHRKPKTQKNLADSFNLRMSIDNPAASVEFQGGKEDYWIGIYRASEMTMQEALGFAAE